MAQRLLNVYSQLHCPPHVSQSRIELIRGRDVLLTLPEESNFHAVRRLSATWLEHTKVVIGPILRIDLGEKE